MYLTLFFPSYCFTILLKEKYTEYIGLYSKKHVYVYVYVYVYVMCMCMCMYMGVCMYVYIYIFHINNILK